MLGPFDHALFAVLVLLGPVWARTFGYRRLLSASGTDRPRVRRSVYRGAMIVQWSLAAAVVALWITARRPWGAVGLALPLVAGLAGVLAGTALIVLLVWRQRTGVLADDEALDHVRARLSHVEPMLPRTRSELHGFYALSVTAGICEELLYRGFILWYLAHYFALLPAAALSAIIFGVGHSYQGPRGILLTGMVGAFLVAVYLIAGSLYPAMLLHALMDAHSGHLAYEALRRADRREALEEAAGDEAAEERFNSEGGHPREPAEPSVAEADDST